MDFVGNDIIRWLGEQPSLDALKARYPNLWEVTGRELLSVLGKKRIGLVAEHLSHVRAAEALALSQLTAGREIRTRAVKSLIQCRMAVLAMDQILAGAVVGKDTGPLRFNWWNGTILQRLLFKKELSRKAVSYGWFRFWWKWLPQRRFLMPLVQGKGIYCFYSKPFLRGLAQLIGARPTLEVAAGDGTLTRLLREEGVDIRATDDYSWAHAIQYPEEVEKLPVSPSLVKYKPRVVVCSWPPPNNTFERAIFSFPTVEQYIVIGSRHEFATGNWKEYRLQKLFDRKQDHSLSRYVLPPEVDPAVHVFQRISK